MFTVLEQYPWTRPISNPNSQLFSNEARRQQIAADRRHPTAVPSVLRSESFLVILRVSTHSPPFCDH
jgi:hypothetical protein